MLFRHLSNVRRRWPGAMLCVVLSSGLAALEPRCAAQQSHLNNAVRLLENGDLSASEREAKIASATGRDRAFALSVLGAIRLQQRKYEASAEFLEAALRMNPQLVGAQLNLGNVYMLQGKPRLAEPRFRAALKLAPSNFDARFALARLESETGHYAESNDLARPVFGELQRTPAGIMLLVSNYLALGDEKSACSLLPAWLSLNHSDPEFTSSLAQLFANHQLFKAAIAVLESEQGEGERSADVSAALGGYYLRIDELEKATANFKSALNAHDDCVNCLVGLARISDRLLNPEEALSYIMRARALSPQNPEVLFRYGELCLRRDLYTDAIESLGAANRLQPDNPSIQYVLASAYTGNKEYKSAIPILETLLAKKPKDALLNYSLGAVEYLNSDLSAAAVHLQRSIDADPEQVASYYYLGLTKDHQGQTDQAMKVLQSLAARFPDHAPTLLALGELLSRQRDYAGAKPLLERATRLDPSSVKSHYQLGLVLSRMGESEASKKEFAEVKALNTKAAEQPEVKIFSNQK